MVTLKTFLLKFFTVFSVLYLFFHVVDIFFNALFFLRMIIVLASFSILNFMGLPAGVSDMTIRLWDSSFTIVTSCTGVVSFSIFAALLYATPLNNNKRKPIYLALFFPLTTLWNVMRVILTLSMRGDSTELLHNTFWMFSVLLVLGAYLIVLKIDGTKMKIKSSG